MQQHEDDSHAPSEARNSRLGRRLGAAAVVAAVAATANRRSSMDTGNALRTAESHRALNNGGRGRASQQHAVTFNIHIGYNIHSTILGVLY